MSEQKISQAMEALKELPDEDKQFMLGYAAGLTANKPPQSKEQDEEKKE